MKLFEELILVSLEKRAELSRVPSAEEWMALYQEAVKQTLSGVLFSGVERLPKEQRPPSQVLLQWYMLTERMKSMNQRLDKRAAEVTKLLKDAGFSSCVLKGQGVAQLYPNPLRRQCGDIDIWTVAPGEKQPNRKAVLDFLKNKGYQTGEILFHHVDAEIFKDVEVEVHFTPTFAYSPFLQKKFYTFFKEHCEEQCSHIDERLGFAYPTNAFNAVYSLLHIFRHLVQEGIGLRQLLDYYYILMALNDTEREEAMRVLRWMDLERFVSAVMYVEKTVFELDDQHLLCEPNTELGSFLLQEIHRSGNFGHYDVRVQGAANMNVLRRGWTRLSRSFTFISFYPSEILWEPLWKVWHFVWRMKWNKA